jgi:dCTP deaminase
MAVLAREEILRRLYGEVGSPAHRLAVTPLLNPQQVGDASLDVRLGNEFIITRRAHIPSVDPARKGEIERKIGQYQERVRVNFGEEFILHPHHLVLGSTLEYLALPADLTAQVIGRSSWGRLGLIIATATAVAPGFKGAITLELVNVGEAPLVLYPGVVIAQLVIEETTSAAAYQGRYDCPTGPQFSRIYRDPDVGFWAERENFD